MNAYTAGVCDALLEVSRCSKHGAHECKEAEEECEERHVCCGGGARHDSERA